MNTTFRKLLRFVAPAATALGMVAAGPAAAQSPAQSPVAAPLSLHLHDRMEPLAPRWRAMEAQDHLSLHQGYDWCAAWVETHACDPLIVEGVRDGRTQFILPLEIVRRGPVRTARLIASPFSNINTGLYAGEFLGAEAGGQLHRALQLARGRRQVLVIDAGIRRNRFAAHSHGLLGQDGKSPAAIAEEEAASIFETPAVQQEGDA